MKYEDYVERKAPRLPVVLLRISLGAYFLVAAATFVGSGMIRGGTFSQTLAARLAGAQLPLVGSYFRAVSHIQSDVLVPTLVLAVFILTGLALILGLYTRTFSVLAILVLLHPYLLSFYAPGDPASWSAHQTGMRLYEVLMVALVVVTLSSAGRTWGVDGLVWRAQLKREFPAQPEPGETRAVRPAPRSVPSVPIEPVEPIVRRRARATTRRVYVTRAVPEAGLERLRQAGVQLEVNPDDRVLNPEELVQTVAGRDAVLCLLTDRIDEAVLEAASEVEVFANYAVGFDNVDVAAAGKRGILVTNTPGVLTDATADMAWTLLFAAGRRVVEADRYVRAGKFKGWGPMLFPGTDVTGKTLGIIGAGRIGTAMALKSTGFRMNVIYDDLTVNHTLEMELGARKVELEDLLSQADFISVHVNLTEQTRGLLGPAQFARMRPNVVLVNTSRGAVLDEHALVDFLRATPSAAAGLDVYENEPRLTPGLVKLDNCVLLPHIASATRDARVRMAEMAADNILAALDGRRPPNLVNPEALKNRRG